MKKILIIISFVILGTIEGYTQNNKDTYIIFESLTLDSKGFISSDRSEGILFVKIDNNYIFSIAKRANNTSVYLLSFIHNRKITPDQTIEVKPKSYLTELKNRNLLIDWDEFYKGLTEDQIKEFVESLKDNKKVYFINRADIKNDSITIINAELYKPLIY